ncbi:hypothetical protein XELAEV_18011262mg [Xenopus laevis]|uniref:Uncharacterized protein n=1 Tax=Xenopus laevis TaxID=8355 RepID=A0A974HX16_XENLA|nr:hypothetical protein XELAEV_18011262mg [Xenopus laevis]
MAPGPEIWLRAFIDFMEPNDLAVCNLRSGGESVLLGILLEVQRYTQELTIHTSHYIYYLVWEEHYGAFVL